MDEITLHWYFYNWMEDQEEEVNKMKEFGCFVGSFHNYEMAKKIMDKDSGETIHSTEEDMQKAMDYIRNDDSAPKSAVGIKKKKGKIRLNQ